MPSCVFLGCKNCSQKLNKRDGVSFHKFPIDPVIRNYWVSIVRQNREDEKWRPSKFCVVCSSHFKKKDYYFTENGRRLIKKKSVPNLDEPSSRSSRSSSPESSRLPQMSEVSKSFKGKVETLISEIAADHSNSSEASPPELPGPSHENQGTVTEIEITLTPLQFGQMPEQSPEIKQLPRVEDPHIYAVYNTFSKGRLIEELKKYHLQKIQTKTKLNTLHQKIRRLQKRNLALNNILMDLKGKKYINCDTDIE
ncbi:peroxynitrite isomerase THAP4 [Bicyclus anynana]|uniref:Peroxynitrite isomerase THAP4 n=1 Tax=Bicyclus anynana TaxID=110368 RepID=A0A6J1MMB2_BICAN|nr:peroxynitrite isomerase THAP4 [Bicyclus anynana]